MKKIVVAVSGGVDSTVAALLLKERGAEVVGVHLRLHDIDDAEAARAACRDLGIELHEITMADEFRELVMKPFAEEYLAGRTPNPCVMCNPAIKFGLLLKTAIEMGAEALATGHYARVMPPDGEGGWRLLRGVDYRRDQSYFLYRLGAEQLARCKFPLGGMQKDEVKGLAASRGLVVADRAESREICFAPDGEYVKHIEELFPGRIVPGDIVDLDRKVIGAHKGLPHYTVGQRKGMGIAAPEPLYVLAIDAEKNRVIAGTNDKLFAQRVVFGNAFFTAGAPPEKGREVLAKVRYNHPGADAIFEGECDGGYSVRFKERQRAITPGQALVVFDGDLLLGGGSIVSGGQ